MIKTDFNKGWLFCREGETERIAVDVPHDAMLREPRTDDSEGGTNTGWFAGCDYEYTKEFDVSADVIGRELILEFEGVYRNAEVYVNGEKAAFNPYGYGNFYVNITDKAQEGKNWYLVCDTSRENSFIEGDEKIESSFNQAPNSLLIFEER